MSEPSESVVKAVRKFFNSDVGEQLVAWMRENPPTEPHPASEQPHLVQINYGFVKGLEARLRQFEFLSKEPEKPEVDRVPKLHNTRSS